LADREGPRMMGWWHKRCCAKGNHVWGFYSTVGDCRFVRHNNLMSPMKGCVLPYYCKHCRIPGNGAAREQERIIVTKECPKIKITTQIVEVPQ
jgi:hypothetical protein